MNKKNDVNKHDVMERPRDCKKCGGHCCKHVALPIERPSSKRDYDNIRWYLLHENVSILIDNYKDWLIQFHTRCKQLDSSNKCKIYQKRPKICREYPEEDQYCEYETDIPAFRESFNSVEEFENYLERRKIDWKWKR